MEHTDKKLQSIANIIYFYLEGPVANQDFGRQFQLWNKCTEIASAIIIFLNEELIPVRDEEKEILAVNSINKWLSAALEDPLVCNEMKADILVWFDIWSGKNNN